MNLRNYVLLTFLLHLSIGCEKETTSFAPVGQAKKEKSQMEISVERNRAMNEFEREEIQKWINKSEEQFFVMPMNYWSDIKDLHQRSKASSKEKVSLAFYLYDFNEVLIYDKPISFKDIPIEKIPQLKAVRDVMFYLKEGEETTLLVPSALAYGTKGDQNKIEYDIPLIIKLKRL